VTPSPGAALPQQVTLPLASLAQDSAADASTSVAPVTLRTSTGSVTSSFVGSTFLAQPTPPLRSEPQQHVLPLAQAAQELSSPALTPVALLMFATSTGEES
jgi:hypothetical protein